MQSFWLLVFNSVLLHVFLINKVYSLESNYNVECEELRAEDCAFAVSSSGARCVLEKQVDPHDQYKCQTSTIMAERQEEWIEKDECIDLCGLQRMTIGLSTDALLEEDFTRKFCLSQCRTMCPNINDLYTKLAAGEGIYLPSLCDELKKKEKAERGPRRLLITAPSPSYYSSGYGYGYGYDYGAAPPTETNNGFFYNDLSPTSPPNSNNNPLASSPSPSPSPSASPSIPDTNDYYFNPPEGPISSPSSSNPPSASIYPYPYPSPPSPSPSDSLPSPYPYPSSPPSPSNSLPSPYASPPYPSVSSPSVSYTYPPPPFDDSGYGYGVPPSSTPQASSPSNDNTFDYYYNGATTPTSTSPTFNMPDTGF